MFKRKQQVLSFGQKSKMLKNTAKDSKEFGLHPESNRKAFKHVMKRVILSDLLCRNLILSSGAEF